MNDFLETFDLDSEIFAPDILYFFEDFAFDIEVLAFEIFDFQSFFTGS